MTPNGPEPTLVDVLLLEIEVPNYKGDQYMFEIPRITSDATSCVAYMEDAFMQLARPNQTGTTFFPPIKIVSSAAPTSYKSFGSERQNIFGCLLPEVIQGEYALLRFQDRGQQDSSEYTPTGTFTFGVFLDDAPFVATEVGTNKYSFTWQSTTYTVNRLTFYIRLHFYI